MELSGVLIIREISIKQVLLPDGSGDWLPILSVQISFESKKTSSFEALVDSGASITMFHGDFARAIGIIDITTGQRSTMTGAVAGAEMYIYAHEVQLIIGSDKISITAFFSDDLPIAGLLGRNGFFENYIVTFNPTGNEPGFKLERIN